MKAKPDIIRVLSNFFLVIASVAACLILSEIYCRYFWNIYWPSPSSIHQFDPVLGYFNRADHSTQRKDECFSGRLFTNSNGMVNTPNLKIGAGRSEKLRIAVLGDSFYRGGEALPDGDISSFLRRMLPESQVMNFGVSGYGTTQSYLCYKTRARLLNPDIVILGLLPHNDIDDNHPCIGSPKPAPYASIIDGNLDIAYPTNPTSVFFYPIHSFLIRHSAFYSTVYNVLHRHGFNYFTDSNKGNEPDRAKCGNPPWPNQMSSLGVFRSLPEPVWAEAWQITERLILELKKAVESDGAIFILMILAGPDEVDSDALSRLRKEYSNLPNDFNFSYPTNRLVTFANTNSVHFVALLPYFKAYIAEYGLNFPYLSYRCNGHWNPVGHYLAADILLHYMVDNQLLDSALLEPVYRETMFSLDKWISPELILGRDGYKQVYKDGVFTGIPPENPFPPIQ